ncbi:MAG: hypothetical protein HWD85_03850 [Flavobacteriaceae bacterium]|nr:hypothetical protein [Flavobacteriaceae bacterium]
MKITESHIQDLYKFTRKHFVEHYDVQTELVDHLANDIEQIWETKPQLTFQEARAISFKKFGVFGFSTIVDKRSKALGKKYNKILWRFFKEWFQLPKIILTSLIFLLFYTVLSYEEGKTILYIFLLVFALYEIYRGVKLRKEQKRRFKTTGKKWMLEEMIFTTAGSIGILAPVNTYNLFSISDIEVFFTSNIYALLLASILLTIMTISVHIIMNVIPLKAEELLAETYPEYKIQ